MVAGEALTAFAACYIKASDGKVYNSIGTAANAAAKVRGYAAQAYAIGDTNVTLYWDVRVRYGAGMTPGADLYVSATAGGGVLSDVATTGGTAPVGFVIDATRAELKQSRY
jgi:hypothetical protein